MPGKKRAKGRKPKKPTKRRRHHQDTQQSLPIRMANFHELQMREYYIDYSEKDRFELDDLKEFQIKAVESIWKVRHCLSSDAIKARSHLPTKKSWELSSMSLKSHHQSPVDQIGSSTELCSLTFISKVIWGRAWCIC